MLEVALFTGPPPALRGSHEANCVHIAAYTLPPPMPNGGGFVDSGLCGTCQVRNLFFKVHWGHWCIHREDQCDLCDMRERITQRPLLYLKRSVETLPLGPPMRRRHFNDIWASDEVRSEIKGFLDDAHPMAVKSVNRRIRRRCFEVILCGKPHGFRPEIRRLNMSNACVDTYTTTLGLILLFVC